MEENEGRRVACLTISKNYPGLGVIRNYDGTCFPANRGEYRKAAQVNRKIVQTVSKHECCLPFWSKE
jgi:hypothetical protein